MGRNRSNAGFGIVEIIVAMAIFVTIAATASTTILQSFSINRLGNEESQAHLFAQEGLEAVRSIKNRNWASIDIGSTTCGSTATRGLTSSPNWSFSGTSQALGKYTRTITIANVCRDTAGSIVEPGTVYDPDIKKVTSTVAWSFTAGRANSVVLTTYLSRFDKTIRKGGMLVWANGGTSDDQLQYRLLNSPGDWLPIQNVPDFGVPLNRPARVVNLYSSPTRNEKILITTHVGNGPGDDQYTYAQVWNGQNWGNVVLLGSWTGTTFPETRASDGGYMANGTFLVAYEDNTTTPKYRTWDGTSWSSQGSIANIGGNPVWIILSTRPGGNEAMLAVKDQADDTNTVYWNGTSWSGVTEHGTTSGGNSYETVDFVWNENTPTTGALIYNEANDNMPNIRIWNGASWSAAVENINIGGVPRASKLVSRPTANEFLGCFKDSVNDINCLRSTFAPLWSTITNGEVTANTVTTAQRSFAQNFERTGTLGLIVYSDATALPKYRTYNPTTNAFSNQSSLTSLSTNLEAVRILPHPDTDDMIVIMMNSSQGAFSQIWDGANNTFYSTGGYGFTSHGTSGPTDTDMWIDFAWDRL